jgi:hypothetical protein
MSEQISTPHDPGRYFWGADAAPDDAARGVAVAPRTHRGIRARYFNAYRLAAYVLVLFAYGHTFGAVIPTPQFGAESAAVASAMKTVHFAAQGANCTWYGFYRGFGIFVSIFFVFSALMAWHLGGRTVEERRAFAPVTWALFASFAGSIVTSSVYFFPAPIVFSILVTARLLTKDSAPRSRRARRLLRRRLG